MHKKLNKRKKLNKVIIFILLCILFVTTSNLWLPLPARFLLVKDNIQKADCIVVLGGDTYFRFKKAVQLYNDGLSKNIVVSVLPEPKGELGEYYNFEKQILGIKDISQKEYILRAFQYFGKDKEGILFTYQNVTSTFEEAEAAKEFLLKNGFKSMILVTSTYHMKRALVIFNSVFKGSSIRIYNSTAKNEIYNPAKWWLKESDVKMVLQEYLSIIQNFIYHSLLKKKRTAFDTYY